MPEPTLTIGTTGGNYFRRPFTLTPTELATHKHVIGLTGQGKSKLLASMYTQLVRQGVPAAVIDPHGDLAQDIFSIMREQTNLKGVWYVDFRRDDRALPWNILNQPRFTTHDITEQLTNLIERIWPALADGAAPLFETIVINAAHVLVENHLPITKLPEVVTDTDYRNTLLLNVTDQNVIHFWHERFDKWDNREARDSVESTLRRINILTYNPTLKHSLGQGENWLDFRVLMDAGVSIIFDLGGLNERVQRFIGCLLTIGFEVAALSREDIIDAKKRRQYHLFMDEFSMFSAQTEGSLSRILSLTRKYGLFLVMAHQTWGQVGERLQTALENALSISFRLGPTDAEWMAKQLTHYEPGDTKHAAGKEAFVSLPEQYKKKADELESLKKRTCYVKLPEARKRWWKKLPRVYKVKTLDFAQPTITHAELERLKDVYSEVLMTPVAEIGARAPVPVDELPPEA